MGDTLNIENDWSNIKSVFRDAGVLTKLFLIVTFFLALSAIASLADTIFAWKGFILEAINFYRGYFVEPLRSLSLNFGLHFSENEIHAATFLSISVATSMRILSLGQVVAFNEINEKYSSSVTPNLAPFWAIGFAFSVGIWFWYGLTEQIVRLWTVALVFILNPAFIAVPKMIMAKFKYEYFEKEKFNYFLAYYAYVIFVLLIVGILGAVNTGLKKSDPEVQVSKKSNLEINWKLI